MPRISVAACRICRSASGRPSHFPANVTGPPCIGGRRTGEDRVRGSVNASALTAKARPRYDHPRYPFASTIPPRVSLAAIVPPGARLGRLVRRRERHGRPTPRVSRSAQEPEEGNFPPRALMYRAPSVDGISSSRDRRRTRRHRRRCHRSAARRSSWSSRRACRHAAGRARAPHSRSSSR